MVRPKRPATVWATCRPVGIEPVNEMRGTRSSLSSCSPTTLPEPTSNEKTGGAPWASSTEATIRVTATAVSGASDDGFQIMESPTTAPTSAFQDHTAAGKLKAVTTPTGPKGCQYSRTEWAGRSLAMVNP